MLLLPQGRWSGTELTKGTRRLQESHFSEPRKWVGIAPLVKPANSYFTHCAIDITCWLVMSRGAGRPIFFRNLWTEPWTGLKLNECISTSCFTTITLMILKMCGLQCASYKTCCESFEEYQDRSSLISIIVNYLTYHTEYTVPHLLHLL